MRRTPQESSRRVSLTEVAREAGVSPATASRVLNNAKNADRVGADIVRKVRDTAERLGYLTDYHHRSIRLGRAETLALVIESNVPPRDRVPRSFIEHEYWASIIAGAEVATRFAGYALSLIGPVEGQTALVRALQGHRQRRFDGLIVPHGVPHLLLPQLRDLNASSDLPLVLLDVPLETGFHAVRFDERAAVRETLAHLRGLGHRHVLWLGPTSGHPAVARLGREDAFTEEAAAAGLDADLCVFDFDRRAPDAHTEFRRAATTALSIRLRRGDIPFTAVIAFNDRVASAALSALRRAGLEVPRDMSVVGFDNVSAPHLDVPLTSVDLGFYGMGYHAVRMLIERIRPDNAPAIAFPPSPEPLRTEGRCVYIPPALVVRESTDKPALRR